MLFVLTIFPFFCITVNQNQTRYEVISPPHNEEPKQGCAEMRDHLFIFNIEPKIMTQSHPDQELGSGSKIGIQIMITDPDQRSDKRIRVKDHDKGSI